MRSLLWEIQSRYMTEEAIEKEYIDPAHVDLVAEYGKMNKMFFDNSLRMYPLRWNNRKKMAGITKFLVKRHDGKKEYHVKSVEVSTFQNMTLKAFRDVLVHEMVHVYLAERGIEDNHGLNFQREMKRINSMNKGVTVSISRDIDDPEIGHKGGKRFAAFVAKTSSITGVAVAQEKDASVVASKIVELCSNTGFRKGFSISVYFSDAPWLNSYSIIRPGSMKRIPGFYDIKSYKLAELESGTYAGRIDPEVGYSPPESGGIRLDVKTNIKTPESKKSKSTYMVFIPTLGEKDNVIVVDGKYKAGGVNAVYDFASMTMKSDFHFKIFATNLGWVDEYAVKVKPTISTIKSHKVDYDKIMDVVSSGVQIGEMDIRGVKGTR